MSEEFLRNMKVIYGGRKKIIKVGDRYAVFLTSALNKVWEYLRERGLKVNIYIVVETETGK